MTDSDFTRLPGDIPPQVAGEITTHQQSPKVAAPTPASEQPAELCFPASETMLSGREVSALTECLQALRDAVSLLTAMAANNSAPGELLTAEELAERLRLPARTIKQQAAAGLIPHHRIGKHYRFSVDDIEEMLRLTKKIPRVHQRRSGTRRLT